MSKESCICLIQQKELKQSYAQFLGVQIPESCVILQVEARNNNIQELANFINDGSFADQLKEGGVKIMAIPNNGKVYIVLQAEFIDSTFKEMSSLVPSETPFVPPTHLECKRLAKVARFRTNEKSIF